MTINPAMPTVHGWLSITTMAIAMKVASVSSWIAPWGAIAGAMEMAACGPWIVPWRAVDTAMAGAMVEQHELAGPKPASQVTILLRRVEHALAAAFSARALGTPAPRRPLQSPSRLQPLSESQASVGAGQRRRPARLVTDQ